MNPTSFTHRHAKFEPQSVRESKMLKYESINSAIICGEINWYNIEKLASSLCRINHSDLQLFCWYTLSKANNAGLKGLCDGLEKIIILMQQCWPSLRPETLESRLQILSLLCGQLQQFLSAFQTRDDDLAQLYQLEKRLVLLEETLELQAQKHLSQLNRLKVQVNKLINSLTPLHPQGSPEDASDSRKKSTGLRSLKNFLRYGCGFLFGISIMATPGDTGWDINRLRPLSPLLSGLNAPSLLVPLLYKTERLAK